MEIELKLKSHRHIIIIDYKRKKITNHYCFSNYNLLKKCFNSLYIIFNTNKNEQTLIIIKLKFYSKNKFIINLIEVY